MTIPRPPHVPHCLISPSVIAPEPRQWSQRICLGTVTCETRRERSTRFRIEGAHLDMLSVVHVCQIDFQRRQHARSTLLLLPLSPCKARSSIINRPRDAWKHTEELAKHVKGIMMPASLFLGFMLFQTLRAVSIVDGPRFSVTQDFISYNGRRVSCMPPSSRLLCLPSEMAMNLSSASGEEFLSGWYFRLNFCDGTYQHHRTTIRKYDIPCMPS